MTAVPGDLLNQLAALDDGSRVDLATVAVCTLGLGLLAFAAWVYYVAKKYPRQGPLA